MTDIIEEFYSNYPYPNVHYFDAKRAQTYAQPLLHAAGLKMEDLAGKKILDAGCGTGEIAISMATHATHVNACDVSQPSLARARENARRVSVNNIHFFHADMMQLPAQPKYDLVTSFGVLHHTRHAKKGFSILSKRTRKSGMMVVGFYHAWGGIQQRVEKGIARILGGKNPEEILEWLSRTKKRKFGESEKAYWADRLANPREEYFRIGDIAQWFDENGFELVGIQGHKPAWKVNNVNHFLERWLFEIFIFLRGKRFVIMSGIKK